MARMPKRAESSNQEKVNNIKEDKSWD